MEEWLLDLFSATWYSDTQVGCVDCANVADDSATSRVYRGGRWGSDTTQLRAALRGRSAPTSDYGPGTGVRCARDP